MAKERSRAGYNRGSLTDVVKGMFKPGTEFRTGEGRLKSEFSPLSYGNKGYADIRKMRLTDDFQGTGKKNIRDYYGNRYRVTSKSFAASFDQRNVVVLGNGKDGLKIVALQLNAAAYYVDVAMDQWKSVLTQRALEVFRESCSKKHFNSNTNGRRWQGLMKSTIDKRRRAGLWPGAGRILEATGALKESLVQMKSKFGYMVTEKPVNDRYGKGKTRKRIYAGVHNDPKFFGATTYSNGTPYVKRKFMGHSALIDEFMLTYQSRYLFDNVFRVPNGA